MKKWNNEDVISVEDVERWDSKVSQEDFDIFEKDMSEKVENVTQIVDKEVSGKIGNLDDLETIDKTTIVNAVNEIRSESKEFVKAIKWTDGTGTKTFKPNQQNGILSLNDGVYDSVSGSVIAEGDMMNFSGYERDVGATHYNVNELKFLLDEDTFKLASGIAVKFDLVSIPFEYNSEEQSSPALSWFRKHKLIHVLPKTSDINKDNINTAYFISDKAEENIFYFPKKELEGTSGFARSFEGDFYEVGYKPEIPKKVVFFNTYHEGGLTFLGEKNSFTFVNEVDVVEEIFLNHIIIKDKDVVSPKKDSSKVFFGKKEDENFNLDHTNIKNLTIKACLEKNILTIDPVPILYGTGGSIKLPKNFYIPLFGYVPVPTKIYYY